MAIIGRKDDFMRDLKTQLGKHLRDLRKQKGMTQEQLAEKALISVDFFESC